METLKYGDVEKAYDGDLEEVRRRFAEAVEERAARVEPVGFEVKEIGDSGLIELTAGKQGFLLTAKQAQDLALGLRMTARRIELRVRGAKRSARGKRR